MKIAVIGVGAVGGLMAGRLAEAGHDVGLVARGATLEALRSRGLRIVLAGRERHFGLEATARGGALGPQDAVILATKSQDVAGALPELTPMLGPRTAVVPAQNGIPWWYFYRLPGPWQDRRVEAVDPGGSIWDAIGPARAIGCVVYPACEMAAPGVIRHVEGDRFSLGEPDGTKSERVTRLASALIAAGLRAPVRARIRNEIWVKLWGNVAFNPVSALTRATLDVVLADPGARALCRQLMLEAEAVAHALGEEFAIDVDARLAGAEKVGAHRTSMLQDLESGRPLELDAIVGAVAELGRVVGRPTPLVDAVHALTALLARSRHADQPRSTAQ